MTARTERAPDYLPPILVVDDNDDDFDTVVMAAQRGQLRHRLVRATDADEARRLLAATPAVTYALVLLDCNLPGEDGLALLQEMRRDARHGALPVVVLTASINPRDRDAFYAAGANAYHVKTVHFSDGLDNVQQLLHYWLTQAILPTTDVLRTGKSLWL